MNPVLKPVQVCRSGRAVLSRGLEDAPEPVLDAREGGADPVELNCDLADFMPPRPPAVQQSPLDMAPGHTNVADCCGDEFGLVGIVRHLRP